MDEKRIGLLDAILEHACTAIALQIDRIAPDNDYFLQLQSNLRAIKQYGNRQGNSDLTKLVTSVFHLIEGKNADAPGLSGEYAVLWEQIKNFTEAYRIYDRADTENDLQQKIDLCERGLLILGELPTQRFENSSSLLLPGLPVVVSPHELWGNLHRALADALSVHQISYAQNIERAIEHYNLALQVFTPQKSPRTYAVIQDALGSAYADRIFGDKADNYEKALTHYLRAERILTKEKFPKEFAGVEHNIGALYIERIAGNRNQNLQQAFLHLKQALELREPKSYGWALTQNVLGNVYWERGETEEAKKCYELALQACDRSKDPQFFGMLLNNLGGCYAQLAVIRANEDDFKKAIDYYSRSLEIRTKTDFPFEWAQTHLNIALVYSNQANVDNNGNEYRQLAASHFEKALEIFRPGIYSNEYAKVLRNMGDLYFNAGKWEKALDAYLLITNMRENLLSETYSSDGQEDVVSNTYRAYRFAVFSLSMLGKFSESFLLRERGVARLFLSTSTATPIPLSRNDDGLIEKYENAKKNIRELEGYMRNASLHPSGNYHQIAVILQRAHQYLDEIIIEVRKSYPDFPSQWRSLKEALSYLPQDTTLVAPLITPKGTVVFVLPQSITTIQDEHVLFIPDLTSTTFDERILDEWTRGWNILLSRRPESNFQWRIIIQKICERLWDVLMVHVYARLKVFHNKKVVIVSDGNLNLLPLHAAGKRQSNGKLLTFLHEYEVSYIPSISVLATCNYRARKYEGAKALVGGVSQYHQLTPLKFAIDEARFVAEMMQTEPLLDGDVTSDMVLQRSPDCNYIHLSCHARYLWGNPYRSSLVFSNSELILNDIVSKMHLPKTKLVVLSACETGITDINRMPGEYLGLAGGFLKIGAAGVISSLWQVDDEGTREMMKEIYKGYIQRGQPIQSALRYAQLQFANGEKGKRYAHPYYWAAFLYAGATNLYFASNKKGV